MVLEGYRCLTHLNFFVSKKKKTLNVLIKCISFCIFTGNLYNPGILIQKPSQEVVTNTISNPISFGNNIKGLVALQFGQCQTRISTHQGWLHKLDTQLNPISLENKRRRTWNLYPNISSTIRPKGRNFYSEWQKKQQPHMSPELSEPILVANFSTHK